MRLVQRIMLVLCIPTLMSSPSQVPKKSSVDSSVGYARARFWDIKTVSPVESDSHSMVFTLSTSWIPGQNRKGFFRYKVTATSLLLDGDNQSKYLDKAHDCRFFLELSDDQGFKLRSVEIYLMRGMSASGQVTSLSANDMEQMDMSEYKSFINGGNWEMSWIKSGSCR